jgi:hypothetical protein
MTEPVYFQWQNEILCETIYPMRKEKLRDFLVFFQEVDLWAEYKNKGDLTSDIQEYTEAQKLAAAAAFKQYSSMREYFMRPDVRTEYSSFKPIDETELTEINQLHGVFIDSWPKDIRGERSFVEMEIQAWTNHLNLLRDRIKSRQRRQEAMDPNHPEYAPEKAELQGWVNVTQPMAEHELDQLHAFLDTYDKIEKRKLDWYWMVQRGQAPAGMTEAEFLVQYKPDQPPTARDIVNWKAQAYKESLEDKNQYQLLDEIHQRFMREPARYPLWLQYMVVHFSGMRYASAHGSWADPRDLLVRLHAPKIEDEIKNLDDETVAKLCTEKVAVYESPSGGAPRPKLADAQEKEWRDQIGWYLPNLKANSPSTRRLGLTQMRKAEESYETRSKSTQEVLDTLRSMKSQFPGWAWKIIVKLTLLRLTEVTAPDWEKLTPEEEQESYARESYPLRSIIDAWANYDATAWREEHGRTEELIVTRAVCNETAEHIQHCRGYLPPGGLTPSPKWYLTNESDNKLPGPPPSYFVKAKTAEQYTPGASVLWLRFVDKMPDPWQVAKPVETKAKVGLLPDSFANRKQNDGGKRGTDWNYKMGEVITRERFMVNEDAKKINRKGARELQFLRWIHEATVVEVAETADGTMVLTYETALPDDYKGTSSIGMFKKPLGYFLSDFMVEGNEDTYNRSFVGYVPEGQIPLEHLKAMLDWNKILRR